MLTLLGAGLFASTALGQSIPSYVLEYAPLVYLHSEDRYRPADLSTHLQNTQPEVNFTLVEGTYDLNNLDDLNDKGGDNVFLTSKVDVTTNPSWFEGVTPDSNGKTGDAISCAIITHDRGDSNIDAFYMYFYSFDWPGEVFQNPDIILGHHVGDWEHNMIRFQNGKPQALWYSQHSGGIAYKYDAVEKSGQRPIAYSGNGTHATYAQSGTQIRIPGILTDFTDKGLLWDPTLSAYMYSFNANDSSFTPYDDSYPTAWLSFVGRWGDEEYPEDDPRQADNLFKDISERYISGPTGPIAKNLDRKKVCPSDDLCAILPFLVPH